jgi:D-serine deaminase-like pyridoxal phosphate-dependent protein
LYKFTIFLFNFNGWVRFGYCSRFSPTAVIGAIAQKVRASSLADQFFLSAKHLPAQGGHPLDRRVKFLNLTGYRFVSQSEEHLVLEVASADWARYPVGHLFYGVPYHICPTVNLYQEVQVVENGRVTGQWAVVARNRRITV